jgi:hypothetical protein
MSALRARHAGITPGTVARKPVTGESAKEAVKTNRAGSAGMFGEPVVTYLRAFSILHAELRVRLAPGIPCSLCFRRDVVCKDSEAVVSRE